MKLITLATLTLTLLAPVTHGAESKAEQLQVLEDARNVALTASRKQDALLAGLICERRPEERNCEGQILVLLEQYKRNVVKMHGLEESYHSTRAKLNSAEYGKALEDTDPKSYPAGQ
ncbi:hypothetical protein NVP1103O_91 [Vibrio phage 1.103.O._10N.261.52.F2]|nr:hypothetical protein NVP1032O_93 [Vibrio phage 1.032.O._10N.261.54.F5]AUR87748.1 hypothetical protein NVP1103O_91 [Vibrio phage 1.103.O._10N.261.52.F2]